MNTIKPKKHLIFNNQLLLSIALLFLFSFFLNAQETRTFNSSTLFEVPSGVTSIVVQAWGGGGAGGGASAPRNSQIVGTGGQGGRYSSGTISVTPGQTLNIYVANSVPGNSGNGLNGGSSRVTGNNSQIFAAGGQGGIANASANSSSGGGGNGANGGGQGGTSVSLNNHGRSGSAPGGGGSGASSKGDFFTRGATLNGGAGAHGRIILSYNVDNNCSGATDLNLWSQTGNASDGNWVVSSDGSYVDQTTNASPTFFVSPETFFNTTIEGTFQVRTTGDDDFIGFVFGYNTPSDLQAYPMEADFLLFDWKQLNQYYQGGTAYAGTYLSKVKGTFTSSTDLFNALWDHGFPNDHEPRVTILRKDDNIVPHSNGWADNTVYSFKLEYYETNIKIYIDGALKYDVPGTFSPGKFGFYNSSQGQVRYSGFTQEFSVGIAGTDVSCSGASDGSATATPSSFGTTPFTYVWSNGETTQTINALEAGTYTVTVTDASQCSAEATVEIGVAPDTIPPTITCPENKIGTLNDNCEYALYDFTKDESIVVSDNCTDESDITITQSPAPGFVMSGEGTTQTVTLTADDGNGNTASCTFTVTTVDATPPVAVAQDLTVELNDNGEAIITVNDIGSGSSDNCGSISTSIDITDFDCSNIGENTVTLTVSDEHEGTFGYFTDSDLDIGSGTERITLGDLDDDGDLDLFVSNQSADNEIWINDGSGNYTNSGQSLAAGAGAAGQAVLGDLDGDGDLDAFLPVRLGNDQIWFNDGTGTFTQGASISGSGGKSNSAILGDLDNDGDLDAVILSSQASNRVYFNDGNGVFSNQQTFGLSSENSAAGDLGDLDGDGDLDLFHTNIQNAPTYVYFNDGTGNLIKSVQNIGNASSSIQLGDLDADGDLDAYVANSAGADKIYENDGNGIFTLLQNVGNTRSGSVSLADLDLDGDLDAFVAPSYNSFAQVWFNDGSASFINNGQNLSYGVIASLSSDIGDIDNDGDLDVVTTVPNKPLKLWFNSRFPNVPVTTTATVTVEDNIKPTITCADDITVDNDPGECGAVVTYEVTFDDNCDGETIEQTAGLPSGSVFPVGTTTNTFVVTDAANNKTECSFDVTVSDTESPIFGINSEIELYSNDFENPNGITQNGSFWDLSLFQTINYLYGADWQNTFTVETILINGPTGTNDGYGIYTDPTGQGGNYSIGMLSTAQDDRLSLTFDTQGKDFLNVSMDLSAIDLTRNGNSGSFGVSTPTMRLRLYDSPGGVFNISSPGTPLVVKDLIGVAPSTDGPFTFNWVEVIAGLDASGSTDGNVSLMFDMMNSGYASFDNLVITASNVSIEQVCVEDISIYTDPGSCEATNVDLGTPVTSDNCPDELVSNDAPTSFPLGTTTVTWTVTDGAGNMATCEQIVTVVDDQEPVISCQSDISINATSAAGATVNYNVPVGTDNCDSPVTQQIAGLATGETFPIGDTVVTYEVTDASGNKADCSFTVTVTGLPPVIECPGNIIVDNDPTACGANVSFAATETVGIPASTITYSHMPGSEFPVGTTTVTATATNAVGTDSCTFTVTVTDNEDPVVTCLDDTIQLDQNGTASINVTDINGGTSDNCGISSVLFATGPAVEAQLVTNGSFANGNDDGYEWAKSNIGINEGWQSSGGNPDAYFKLDGNGDTNTDPTILQTLNNLQIGNTYTITGSYRGYVAPSSNEGNVFAIDLDDFELMQLPNPGLFWTSFSVTFVASAENQNIGFRAEIEGSNVAIGVDNISTKQPPYTTANSIDFDCSNVGDNTVILLVTDIYGNRSTCTGTVTVEDKEEPIVVCNDIEIELDALGNYTLTQADIDAIGYGSTDNCGEVTFSVDQTHFDCDDVNLTASNDYAIETDGANDYLNMGDLNNALDNSNQATYQIWMKPLSNSNGNYQSYIESNGGGNYLSLESGIGGSQAKIGLWVKGTGGDANAYTDANVLVMEQWINITAVYDGTQVNNLDRIKIYVNGVEKLLNINGTVPNSLNDLPNFFMGSQNGSAQFAKNQYDEVRVWNKALTASEIASNWDNTIVGNEPGLVAYYAFEDGPGSSTVTELTSQGPATLNNMDPNTAWVPGASGLTGGFRFVTLTVTDSHSNTSTCTARVTVEDNTYPTLDAASNETVECDGDGNIDALNDWLSSNGGAEASDACGVVWTNDYTALSDGCGSAGSATVTFTATDPSENSVSTTAIFTIEDKVLPTFTAPADITLYKDATCSVDDSPDGLAGDVTDETDNCSTALNATFSDSVENNCEGTYTITRTWSLVDNCENPAEDQVQIITVKDIIVPTFTAPADITLYKDATCSVDDSPDGLAGDVTDETDNCSTALNATFSDSVENNCEGTYTITRTWSLVDNCENPAEDQVQIITVKDIIVPTFTAPADITLYKDATCSVDDSPDGLAGDVTDETDNCSTALNATFSDSVENNCEGTYTITRTWSLVDNCENPAEDQVQIITVLDITAPTVICKNITVTLNETGNVSISDDAVDNGSSDTCGTITYSTDIKAFTCDDIGENTVTLTVTDDCGNSSSCQATVTVQGIIPVVAIGRSLFPEFCQGAYELLTASSDEARSDDDYVWETADGDFNLTDDASIIEVGANGTYTVTVTSDTNCSSSETFTITDFDAQGLLSSYTLLAQEDIHLHDNNTVTSGGVGLLTVKGEAKIHDETDVNGFVRALDIDIDDSFVAELVDAVADVPLPAFAYNTVTNGDSEDVKAEDGEILVLDGSVYGKIEVKDGSTVIFTNPNVFIEELKVDDDGHVEFEQSTNLYVQKDVDMDKDTNFNQTGDHTVVIYAEEDVDVKEGSNFNANVYSLKDIDAKGKDDNPTTMTGLFIADKIKGQDHVTWGPGTSCSPAEVIVPPVVENCECKGGMVEVSFTYYGSETPTTNSGEITNNGDGSYTIVDGGEKLEKGLEITVGNDTAEVHTSCSQEVLGVTFIGGIKVIGYVDTYGHSCSLESETNPAAKSTIVPDDVVLNLTDFGAKVWPIPSDKNFKLRVTTRNTTDKIVIHVFDVTNKLVHIDKFNWNQEYKFGASLEAGLYFVNITQSNNTKMIRVIKH